MGFRQPQSFHSWVLAFLRYALAVHLCDGWAKFGGFSAQLNFLSVILHVAVVENPGTALIYARLAAARVEKLARDRDTRTNFFELLSFESADLRAKAVKENSAVLEAMSKKKEAEKKKKLKEKEGSKQNDGQRQRKRKNRRPFRGGRRDSSRNRSRQRSRAKSRSHRPAASRRSKRSRSKRSKRKETPKKVMKKKKYLVQL